MVSYEDNNTLAQCMILVLILSNEQLHAMLHLLLHCYAYNVLQ